MKLKRTIAFCIDLVFVNIITGLSKELFLGSFNFYDQPFLVSISYIPISLLCYFLLFDLFFKGQSIGKALYKIKVVNESGAIPSLQERIARTFLKFWSMNFILISFSAYYMNGWVFHEHVLKTVTIREN